MKDYLGKRKLIEDHIASLRRIPTLADTPIVMVIESNMGDAALQVARHAEKMPRVHVWYEKDRSTPGIYKSESVTVKYVHRMSVILERDYLRFSAHFTTSSRQYMCNAERMKGSLQEELRQMHYEGKKITGKGVSGTSGNDDKAVVACMIGFWPTACMKTRPEFIRQVCRV